MIQLPKYTPDQWVIYKDNDDKAAFGFIGSGDYMSNQEFTGWTYNVAARNDETGRTGARVREDEILAYFDGRDWHRSDTPNAKHAKRGLYL